MAYKIGDLVAVLSLDDKLSSGMTRAGDSMQKFGRETLVLSGAVAALGAASIASAMQFDKTLTKMTTLAGVASGELQMVKENILALGPAVGKGPQELADAMMAISSTTDDTVVALEILEKAAQMSATGMGVTKDVGKALTAVINSYGKENITAARAADILTQTVKDGGAEADELASVLANVVPAAAQLGISLEEVGANIATVTKLGVPAAESVTQLSSVLTAMVKPTNEGTAALKSIGMSYASLRDMADESLQKALQHVTDKLGGNEEALANIFGRIEAYRNIMATTTVQAGTYAKELDRMTNSLGVQTAAHHEFEKTASATWERFTARLKTASIELGMRLTPAVMRTLDAMKPLLTAVEGIIKGFSALPSPVQTLVVGTGAFVAVMAPLALAIGSTVTAVGTLAGVLMKLGPIMTAGFAQMTSLRVGMGMVQVSAVATSTSIGLLGAVMLKAFIVPAIGVALGLLVKSLAEAAIAADDLANQENAVAAQNDIILANAAKQKRADETAATAAKRLADEKSKLAQSVAKLVVVTDAEIIANLKATKQLEDVEAATKKFGKAVDPKLAARILAISDAQDKAADSAKKWKEEMEELDRELRASAVAAGALEIEKMWEDYAKGWAELDADIAKTDWGKVEAHAREFKEAMAEMLDFGDIDIDTAQGAELFEMKLRQMFGDGLAGLNEEISDADLDAHLQEIFGDKSQTDMDRFNIKMTNTVSVIEAVAGAVEAAIGAYHNFIAATDSASKAQRALGGAAVGANLGKNIGMLFGPVGAAWGTVIGAVVGGVAGIIREPAWVKVAEEAGKILGGGVSKGLAKQIRDTKFEFGVSNKDAALLNLGAFMGETGKTAMQVAPQITMLMDAIVTGAVPAARGLEEINGLFEELAGAAADGDREAKKLTQTLIQQGLAAGKLSESMENFAREAVGKISEGGSKIIEGMSLIIAPLGDMGTAAAQMFAAGFTARIAEVGIVAALEESGAQIETVFQKLMEEGNTLAAAMLAPFQQLSAAINNEADPSVKGFLVTLQGMGEVFSGMDQLGFVSRSAFEGLTTGVLGTVNALSEAGISGEAMYMAIAPQLGQLIAASEEYGFVLDDNTQALVDGAAQYGISFPTDPLQILVDLVGQLVVLMGGTLPESMTAIPPAAEAAFGGAEVAVDEFAASTSTSLDTLAGDTTTTLSEMALDVESAMAAASGTAMLALDDVAGALEAIPSDKDVSINVRFNREGMPRNDDGSIDWDGNPANSFRGGTLGFEEFGSGTPAMLHGTEGVFTPEQLDSIIATALRGVGGKGAQQQSGDVYVNVNITLPGGAVLKYVEAATKRGDVRVHPNAVRSF